MSNISGSDTMNMRKSIKYGIGLNSSRSSKHQYHHAHWTIGKCTLYINVYAGLFPICQKPSYGSLLYRICWIKFSKLMTIFQFETAIVTKYLFVFTFWLIACKIRFINYSNIFGKSSMHTFCYVFLWLKTFPNQDCHIFVLNRFGIVECKFHCNNIRRCT